MPRENSDAPLSFAYWVPNVSSGLLTSTIEQRTDWSFDYSRKLARLAECADREVLPIIRELEMRERLDRAAVPDPLAELSDSDHLLHATA